MNQSALSTLVCGSSRLQSRAIFAGLSAEELNALQQVIYVRAFGEAGERMEFSAATVFRKVAQAIADDAEQWQVQLATAKTFVNAFCLDGMLSYTAARPTRDPLVSIPAFYTLNPQIAAACVADMIRQQPEVIPCKGLKKDSKHSIGAQAMSAHPFKVSRERYQIAARELKAGRYLTRAGTWQEAKTDREKARYSQQVLQLKAGHAVAHAAQGRPYYWPVKCDRRGRMYYVAGIFSPQAGGVAEYLQSNDEQISLDSTASFAQFIAIITNDRSLARACNLTESQTGQPLDFYAEVYKQATGLPLPTKSSFERQTAKAYIMPKAYGAGDDACRARAYELAEEAQFPIEEVGAICDALQNHKSLDSVKFAAGNAAEEAAKTNKQLEWVTPAGFHAEQAYWQTVSKAWKTGAGAADFIPSQITFKVPTGAVSLEKDSGTNAAQVAAAANIVQSLDAAFLADCLAEFYTQTGQTVGACHDSVKLYPAQLEEFREIAWQVFKRHANSIELQGIRKLLGFPVALIRWLPEDPPFFMVEE